MKILHINAGNEYGGGLSHIASLLEKMKTKRDVSLLVFEEGPVAKEARKKGIEVFVLGQTSKFDLRFLDKLKAFIEKGKFNILHSHGPRANLYVSRIIKKIRPIKWVITVHSNPYLDFKGRGVIGKVFQTLNIKSYSHADAIISVSREIEGIVSKHKNHSTKSFVIHNGIEFRNIDNKQSQGSELFTLLVVGRLEKVKGFDVVIEALNQRPFPIDNWKLIICGEGSEYAHLKELTKKYSLTNNIEFKGWVKKSQLDDYFEQADLYILSSLSESFPLVALEAMEFSTPVIATKVGDVEEMISQEIDKEVFLIEPNEPNKLKDSLSQAYGLFEKNKLTNIGEKFHTHAQQFSSSKHLEETEEVYEELLNEKK